jgi:hypothetical protein
MLENVLGMSPGVHIVFSILLLIGMNFGLVYIIYRASKKNLLVVALASLVLTSVTLFYSIQDYFWGFSPATIRNIEIPLTLGAIMVLALGSKISIWLRCIACIALILLFSSDRLLIGVVAVSLMLLFCFDLLGTRRIDNVKRNRFLYLSVIAAVILAKVIEFTLDKLNIVTFTSTKGLEFTESVTVLFENIPKFFTDLLNITGSDIFNRGLVDAIPYGLNLAILIVLFTIYLLFVRKHWSVSPSFIKVVALFIPASVVLFFLVKNGATDRYLIFILPALLITAAFYLKDISVLRKYWKQAGIMFAVLLLIVIGLFIPARAERASMKPVNYNTIAPPVAKTVEISDVLLRNNISLLMGDFWIIHTTKFHYDTQSINVPLQIVSTELLSEDKIGFKRFISKETWLTNSLKSSGGTAYAIRQTDPQIAHIDTDEVVRAALGEFDRRETVEKDGQRVVVYIFNEDKRVKLIY